MKNGLGQPAKRDKEVGSSGKEFGEEGIQACREELVQVAAHLNGERAPLILGYVCYILSEFFFFFSSGKLKMLK